MTTETPAKTTTRAKAATESEKPTSITALIPLIREEVGAIAKDLQPTSGNKYNYRSSDQIINALVPILNKYKVFTTVEDELVERHTDTIDKGSYKQFLTYSVLKEKVTFHAPDGSTVSSTVISESTDYSDKSLGAAGTYAYRTALVKTFTIPTGEDPEGEAKETDHTVAAPVAIPAASGPSAQDLKNEIADVLLARGDIESVKNGPAIVTLGNKHFGPDDKTWQNETEKLDAWLKVLQSGEVK